MNFGFPFFLQAAPAEGAGLYPGEDGDAAAIPPAQLKLDPSRVRIGAAVSRPAKSEWEQRMDADAQARMRAISDGTYKAPGEDPNKVTDTKAQPAVPADNAALRDIDAGDVGEEETYQEMAGVVPHRPLQLPAVMGPGHAYLPLGGRQMVEEIYRNNAAGQAAIKRVAEIDAAEATEAQGVQRDTRIALEQKYNEHLAAREQDRLAIQARVDHLNSEAENIAKTKLDQGRAFRTPAGILGAIGAVFIAYAAGDKDPTAGVRMIDQIVQRDLDVQRMELQNKQSTLSQKRGLLFDYIQLTRDEEQARLLAEAKMKDIAAMKLMEVGQKYKSPRALEVAQITSTQLQNQANAAVMQANMLAWREYSLLPPAVKAAYDKSAGGNFFERPVKQGVEVPAEAVPPEAKQLGQHPEMAAPGMGVKSGSPTAAKPPQERVEAVAKQLAAIEVAGGKVKPKESLTLNRKIAQAMLNDYYTMPKYRGNPRAAEQAFIEELYEARRDTKAGVPAINKAIGEEASAAVHTLTLARSEIKAARARLGNKFDAFMSKPGLWLGAVGAENSAVTINNISKDLGFTDEQKQAANNLHRSLMMAKQDFILFKAGKSVTGTEKSNLEQIVSNPQTAEDWEDFLDKGGGALQARINIALRQGTPMARRLWLASRPGITPPLPTPGIRGANGGAK